MPQNVQVNIVWRGPQVQQLLNDTMFERMRRVTNDLHRVIKSKISIDVLRDVTGRVIQRSKPGEYPRRDTRKLWNTLFFEVEDQNNGVIEGIVATPLNYGLYLETRISKGRREYLTRGLWEQIPRIKATMTAPIP